MQRRTFFSVPMFGAIASALSVSRYAVSMPSSLSIASSLPPTGREVLATNDGVELTPSEYAALLERLSAQITPDEYSLGGEVAELEQTVAADLGKEAAVWISTGTLANHLALRVLAGEKRRVAVQKESHIYNDCGDCCQTLSGIDLVPLAEGRATYTVDDLNREFSRSESSRVSVPIGALMIETPVRRLSGEMFDFAEIRRIAHWARERGIGLHLDGARLYIASAYSGIAVREYAALFDTVYVSMYKYFNAASGAILAGPKRLLDGLYHPRRMFGNGLCHVWPFATIARHYFPGFQERFAKAIRCTESVLAALKADPRYEVSCVPNGSNIFYLRSRQENAEVLRQRAKSAGLILREPIGGRIPVHVNETWTRRSAQEIISFFG